MRLSSLPIVVALALAAAGCGSGDAEEKQTAAPTTTSTTAEPASVAPVPSPGCGSSKVGVLERERRTITVGGEERWYLLSTPPAHDGTTPLPLVVELHGLAEGAGIAAQMGLMDELGDREGFVSVFPNGSGTPVRWNEKLDADPNLDFQFIQSMLDTLGRDLCIDEARVYATGLSYGAIMSSALACVMADRFAAIAPVSGIQHPDGCTPGRPVPVLAFHGTADPILFFNGGVGDLGAAFSGKPLPPPPSPVDLNGAGYPKAVADWAKANGCGAATDVRKSAHVIERTYDCDDDAETRFFIIEGGGHSWPDSDLSRSLEKIVGPTTDELDATKEIWSFFSRHALPAR